jgi:serine/threonine-protein kinase SRK2
MASGPLDPLKDSTRYKKVQDLSSGSFGFVQLCKNLKTQELVAIKFIERGERVNKYVETEVLNHRMLRHPHVIEFKEVFLTTDHIAIVMEYASGGNLFSYVQRAVRLKEPAARWFLQQLIIGGWHGVLSSPTFLLPLPCVSLNMPFHCRSGLLP